MAVANTKSVGITNADATQPRLQGQPWIQKGALVCGIGTCAVAAADDDNSVYRFVRVPSGARLHSVDLVSQAITGGTVFTLGLYRPATEGGAAVSAALYASALDLSAGNTVPIELVFATRAIASLEQRIWEQLGLTADPFVEYDLCLTGTTVGSGAGNIAIRAAWAL